MLYLLSEEIDIMAVNSFKIEREIKNKDIKNYKKYNICLCPYCFFPIKQRKLIKCDGCGVKFCFDCLGKIESKFFCPDCLVKFVNKEVVFVVTK